MSEVIELQDDPFLGSLGLFVRPGTTTSESRFLEVTSEAKLVKSEPKAAIETDRDHGRRWK